MCEGDCGMLCFWLYWKVGKVGIMLLIWVWGFCCGCWNWVEFEGIIGFVLKVWFFDIVGGGNRRFFRVNFLFNCVCGLWIKFFGKLFFEKEFFLFGVIFGWDGCVISVWDGVLEGEVNMRLVLSFWVVDLLILVEFEVVFVEVWIFFIFWVVNDVWFFFCVGLFEIFVWSKGCELFWVIEGEFFRRFLEFLLISWFLFFLVGVFFCFFCVKV